MTYFEPIAVNADAFLGAYMCFSQSILPEKHSGPIAVQLRHLLTKTNSTAVTKFTHSNVINISRSEIQETVILKQL